MTSKYSAYYLLGRSHLIRKTRGEVKQFQETVRNTGTWLVLGNSASRVLASDLRFRVWAPGTSENGRKNFNSPAS